jgi:hypothetical protein
MQRSPRRPRRGDTSSAPACPVSSPSRAVTLVVRIVASLDGLGTSPACVFLETPTNPELQAHDFEVLMRGLRSHEQKTKQRVPLELTPELEAWVISKIAEARVCAQGPIPAPLVDSPKCARCSLAPVCLPDETRLGIGGVNLEQLSHDQRGEPQVPGTGDGVAL